MNESGRETSQAERAREGATSDTFVFAPEGGVPRQGLKNEAHHWGSIREAVESRRSCTGPSLCVSGASGSAFSFSSGQSLLDKQCKQIDPQRPGRQRPLAIGRIALSLERRERCEARRRRTTAWAFERTAGSRKLRTNSEALGRSSIDHEDHSPRGAVLDFGTEQHN